MNSTALPESDHRKDKKSKSEDAKRENIFYKCLGTVTKAMWVKMCFLFSSAMFPVLCVLYSWKKSVMTPPVIAEKLREPKL